MVRLNQKGLSMVEILIATLVMFLALSILMTVMGVAGTIAFNSRVMDRATFLANQRMEYIRGLRFDQIGYRDADAGYPKYEPPGILPRRETTVVAGTQFEITYSVVWVDDAKDGIKDGQNATDPRDEDYYDGGRAQYNWQDYKRVRVAVSWQRPRPSTFAVVSNISGLKEFALPPLVFFTTGTPANNSLVSGQLTIGVIGMQNTTAGAAISNLGLEIGGGILVFNELISPPQESATAYFTWNTNATPTPDGLYEVRGIARDSQGLESSLSYFYVINNYPPQGSPRLVSSETTESSARLVKLTFNTIKDGRDWVSIYQLSRAQTGLDAALSTVTVSNPQEVTVTVWVAGLQPWTTYDFSLRGFSYGDYSSWGNSLRVTTLMELSWELTDRQGANRTITLRWQNRSDFTGTYRVYWRSPGGTWNTLATISPPNYSVTDTQRRGTVREYKVEARDTLGNLVNYSPVISVTFPD